MLPPGRRGKMLAGAGIILVAALIVAGVIQLAGGGRSPQGAEAGSQAGTMSGEASNPNLDPGTPLHGPAPDFTLVNQYGQRMSLHQFRGKAVILAFTDSQCTTVCPLTTSAMSEARQLLGAAGDQVQLLGVDANPQATSVPAVRSYSSAHGMLNQWDFLTGTPAQLEAVWKAYHIAVQIQRGMIDHTPALLAIGPDGQQRMLYLTAMAYASIDQQAQLLAQEASRLLPGHPQLTRLRPESFVAGTSPASRVTVATVPEPPAGTSGAAQPHGGSSLQLGPGRPHLLVFFATWLQETSDLRGQLAALGQYAQAASGGRLPPLAAVDQAGTEPSPGAAADFVRSLPASPPYPVALDATGHLADGYGVQDQPWYVLTSAAGKIIWSHDGWLPPSQLIAAVRHAGQG
jgi:cytochrome oxidase Cu insertion factor (SCO1/SenC/PrrC family)